MFIQVTGQCPHCTVQKHQIDTNQERAEQIVSDALDAHVAKAHPTTTATVEAPREDR